MILKLLKSCEYKNYSIGLGFKLRYLNYVVSKKS
ncbi:Uncharacterised protein [Sphingobacterium multivorum]|jgi:hypothetical protein|nr:Uncharacterised protein [Sphingobacterium multivorum]